MTGSFAARHDMASEFRAEGYPIPAEVPDDDRVFATRLVLNDEVRYEITYTSRRHLSWVTANVTVHLEDSG